MPIINLKTQYPHLIDDIFLELPDAIIEVYEASRRKESSTMRKRRRYKAQYSLDTGSYLENRTLTPVRSPEEIWLQQVQQDELRIALEHLPPIQSRRVYAHYILGMKKNEIARREGVTSGCVSSTIRSGLKNLKQFYEKHFQHDL